MSQDASGQGWFVEVTDQPLDIARYTQMVTDPAAGAISSFIGTTRNNFHGKAVLRLEYEAYVPMAVAKLKVGRRQQAVLRIATWQLLCCLPRTYSSDNSTGIATSATTVSRPSEHNLPVK
jgi:hypothetical protein